MSTAEERMAVHKQYLDLHKRLKQMREQVSQEVKKISGLKDQLSDWRRAIKKCVGQLMKGSSDEIKRKNKRVVSAHCNTTLFGNVLTLFDRRRRSFNILMLRRESPNPASMSRNT